MPLLPSDRCADNGTVAMTSDDPILQPSLGEMESEVPESNFPCLPVPGKFLSLHEIFEVLRNRATHNFVPDGKKSNVYFVIQSPLPIKGRHKIKLRTPFCDDCGQWDGNLSTLATSYIILDEQGVPRVIYLKNNVYCSGKRIKGTPKRIPLDPQPEPSTVIKMDRRYATLKGCNTYRRRITSVAGREFHNKTVVEYCGIQPAIAIMPQRRVRKKKDRKSACINPPVIRHEEANETDVQKSRESSGFSQGSKDIRWPKNLLSSLAKYQEEREKEKRHVSNQILDVLAMLDDHPSVQEVSHLKNKAPCVILYTDEQVHDMKRNLRWCSSNSSSIGVDRTFNLGDCRVTFTVYKNFRVLDQDSREHPLFLGPVYLHWDEDFETYHYFFAHLQALMEDMVCNLEIRLGDNIDANIMKAIKGCFPVSTHVLCCEQLKKSMTRFVRDQAGCDIDTCAIIISRVLGYNGVTMSPDKTTFKNRMMSLFLNYHQYPMLKDYLDKLSPLLLSYVCEPRQKEWNKGLWLDNCASINDFIKLSLQKSHQKFPVLVEKVGKIITVQMLDLREALCGGESRLLTPFCEKQMDKGEWIKKTEEEKVSFFREFLKKEL